MGELDFTKRRLGSTAENGRKIRKCPRCGRKGTISNYGTHGMCTHTAENHGFCLGVRDFCSLNAEHMGQLSAKGT